MKRYVILGAGVSGLAAAYRLALAGQHVTVVEKSNKVGGHGSSFKRGDFTLDYGPHKLYSQLPGLMPFFKEFLGEECLKMKKLNSIYVMGRMFSFPPKISNLLGNITFRTISGGLHVGFSALPALFPSKPARNFEEYFINGFGKAGYRLMFEGYAKKVWGNPKELSPELARKRVPVEGITHLMGQFVGGKKKKVVSADYFYYPKDGLIKLSERFADEIKKHGGEILLNSKVEKIKREGNMVVSVECGSKSIPGDVFISTLHLRDVVHAMHPELPKETNAAVDALRHSSLKLCYVFLNKQRAMKDAWIFFPGSDIIFNRISEQKAFSPYTCPVGKTVLCAEVTVPPGSPITEWSKEQLFERVKKDLVKVGLIKEEEIFDHFVIGEHGIYPVYDISYAQNLDTVLEGLHKLENVVTLGRPGLFNYNNMDHCIDMAFHIADAELAGNLRESWPELMQRFDSYRIVD